MIFLRNFLLAYVLSIDMQCDDMQAEAMRLVFASIKPEKVQELSRGKDFVEICKWKKSGSFGIYCKEDEVSRFCVNGLQSGNFAIEFLPNTVVQFDLTRAKQRFLIDTRILPRCSIIINMRINNIYGCPDLTTLPDKLKAINLEFNKLTGPVQLTRLPSGLKRIRIGYNRLRQKILFYDQLPKSLEEVMFGEHGITEVRSLNPDEPVHDKSIFCDISADRFA